MGRRREERRAADMIAVVLRDHHIAHGFFRHRLDVFQKSAGIRIVVARIHEDDAFRRHDHHRVGVVLLADIGKDAVGQFLKFRNIAGDRARVHGPSDRGGKRKQCEFQPHGVPPMLHIIADAGSHCSQLFGAAPTAWPEQFRQ